MEVSIASEDTGNCLLWCMLHKLCTCGCMPALSHMHVIIYHSSSKQDDYGGEYPMPVKISGDMGMDVLLQLVCYSWVLECFCILFTVPSCVY